MRTPTQAEFLRDVASHEMSVMLDDGTLRHICFRKPGTSAYHFNITTTPGHLMITGDMGAWTFRRLTDMFEFFRTAHRGDGHLHINLGYWSEKLVASSACGRIDGSAMEYEPTLFRSAIWRRALDLARDARSEGASDAEVSELIEHIKDVRDGGEGSECEAHDAARNFSHQIGSRVYEFHDFWETNLRDYNHNFVWACYAIAWAIKQYDNLKQPTAEEACHVV